MFSHKGVQLFEKIKRTRRCDLVRSVSLGVDFDVSITHARLSSCSFSLSLSSLSEPKGQNVELSTTSPVPCLPTCDHAPHNDDNGQTSETISKLPTKCYCL